MLASGESQKSLMDQCCGLYDLRPGLPAEVSRGEFLQFVVNERNHGGQSLRITFMNTLEQVRNLHVGHSQLQQSFKPI